MAFFNPLEGISPSVNNIGTAINQGLVIASQAAALPHKFDSKLDYLKKKFGLDGPEAEAQRTGKLNDFITQVKKNGLARNNKFAVTLNVPTSVNSNYNTLMGNNADMKMINLMCDAAVLPSVNIATVPMRTYGELVEMPNDKNYGTFRLTFYMDQQMLVKTFFDIWIESIRNGASREFGYYNNYVADMRVIVMDSRMREHYMVSIRDAFPKSIGEVTLSNEGRDLMKLDVEFAYKKYDAVNLKSSVIDGQENVVGSEKEMSWSDKLAFYAGEFKNYQNMFNNLSGDLSRSASLLSKGDVGGLIGQSFGGWLN